MFLADEPDAHAKKGLILIRRYGDELAEGLRKYIVPLSERTDAKQFTALFRKLQLGGAPLDVAERQAKLVVHVMPWLKTRPLFRSTFQGKANTAGRQLAEAVALEAPDEQLRALASISPVSGVTAPRKWIQEAAALAGSPVSPIASTAADAGAVQGMADELRKIGAQLEASDDPKKQLQLRALRDTLREKILKVSQESDNPAAVLGAAIQAIHEQGGHATEYGRKLGLNPQQEGSMVAGGRKVIAAGAGSGKTRVLAGEVAYRINELGFPAESICAVSFTRKASNELVGRVREYGAVISGAGASGFGTTHALAGLLILNQYGRDYRRPKYIGAKEKWKETTLIALAVKQVGMKGGNPKDAPQPRNFFTGDEVPVPQAVKDTPVPSFEEDDESVQEYLDAIRETGRYFQDILDNTPSWKTKVIDWAEKSDGFLRDMYGRVDNGGHPSDLSPGQKSYLNSLLARVPGLNYRVASMRLAAEEADGPDAKRKGMQKYHHFNNAAGQWFNLGVTWGGGGKEGKEGQQFSAAAVKRKVGIWKGAGASPEEVWWGAGAAEGEKPFSPEAAAYAAYEYLKGSSGEPDFRNHGDMTDLLHDAVRTLVKSKKARTALQSRFKVVMVDEAQDLNAVQHLMFGLLAGHLDPSTLKPKADGSMTAEVFSMVGDDKQCISVDAPVDTPDGPRRAGDLKPGASVLSYRNGAVKAQTVRHVVPSHWTHGYKVTTESGNTLTMSPNHRLWATEPRVQEDQVIVYLMHRRDMGFRVGITNKGKVGNEGNHLNSYGSRCFMERAEKLWVLDVCEDRDAALLQEQRLSLKYGIPTQVFNGTNRGLNQERIDTVFKEFGGNGARLIEERHLSFDLPHWMSQSYTKHERQRHVVQLNAHGGGGTNVTMEWSGDKFDEATREMGVKTVPGDRRRLRKWFTNYRDALALAYQVANATDALVSHRLSTPEGVLREIPASALFVGMSLPILEDGGVVLDPIVCIEDVEGQFVDLDVDDASNFFAGGILTHNSIYEFRGADPDQFIDKSDLTDTGGGGFDTYLLDTNYRSGQAIVEAANNLIKHNSKQIPMTCKANYEARGDGAVRAVTHEDTSSAAAAVADEIADSVEAMATDQKKYANFGIAVRSNAEADHYALGMIAKAIPFRSKSDPFRGKHMQAMLGWMTLVEQGRNGDPKLIKEAIAGAIKLPTSFMGKAFVSMVDKQTDPMGWLLDGGALRDVAPNYQKRVKEFIDNVFAAIQHYGSPDTPSDIYRDLLMTLRGGGKSFFDSVVEDIKDNNDKMAEIASENPDGIPTEEQIKEAAEDELTILNGLMGAKDSVDEIMGYTRELKRVNEKTRTDEDDDRDAVTIGTMHSWKGLEVSKMFIPMVRGKFPRAKVEKDPATGKVICTPPDDQIALASERRLAYVAITRGENEVVCLDIPHPKLQDCPPSQFLSEACIQFQGNAGVTSVPEDDAPGRVAKLAEEWGDPAFQDPWSDEVLAKLASQAPPTALEAAWGDPVR